LGEEKSAVKHTFRRLISTLIVGVVFGVLYLSADAATLSPKLGSQLAGLSNDTSVGVVIITFNGSGGLTAANLDLIRSVGIVDGVTFPTLGMVGAVANAGQVRALAANPSVRSIWSNDQQVYHMNQARTVTGVDRIPTDAGFTLRNGGMPLSGEGNFSVFVIDTGIDATHADLPLGTKVIQNTQRVVSTSTGNITIAGVPVRGLTPSVSIENIPNTDNVGHGTHCAGIVGGLGARSGGAYAGVAPGVKIVGSGGGAVILVLDALAGWEYGMAHRDLYKIRIITNSYGPLGGGQFNPDHPFMVAAQKAHDLNITVLFAGGNDGPAKNTLSPYAQAPWVIGVAAGTKEGMLANFSSRGIKREERLADNNPFNDNAAPTLTAPGTGRSFESSFDRFGFTSDIVSVRASTNLTANGTWFSNIGADTELSVGMLPFYTQISGTSMATPFVAGVVALMLDADPTLTPDEIKQILIDTTTRMPGYQDFEVGAGYINAYAALDKVYNRSKAYHNFSDVTFNAQFSEERPPVQNFHIDYDPSVSGPGSTNSRNFTVEPNMNVLDVWAQVDTFAEEGTGNFVGMSVYDPNGVRYGATSIPTPVIGSDIRETLVNDPIPGTWRLEIRGACGLAAVPGVCSPQQLAAPGPVDGNVTQIKFVLPNIPDIQGHPLQTDIEFALKNRLIDTYADGTFRPDQTVTREDLARSLVLNTPMRQSLAATPKFTDVSGDLLRIAEGVTARGSNLRDYDFVSTGMMSFSGSLFNPVGSVNRLDLAVALVKATGHDADARALAGTTVTYQGTPLTDNAQIPASLRGYVQVALNIGLFEAFPAQVIQIAPGQYQVIPGPRFEPATTVSRARLASKLISFRQLFTTGG
jgi:serine protease AprX